MPITHTTDKARHVVTNHVTGLVTLDDVNTNYAAIRNDPEFESSFDQISDCMDENIHADISSEDIGTLSFNTPFDPTTLHAIAATMPAIFGLARMYQQRSLNESNVAVFKTLEDANAWIDAERRKRGTSPAKK